MTPADKAAYLAACGLLILVSLVLTALLTDCDDIPDDEED